MSKIGLIGWYGHYNVGDDALLCVINDFLTTELSQSEIIVIADNPQIISDKFGYKCIKTLPMSLKRFANEWKGLSKVFLDWRMLDDLVLGGGGFFADDVSRKNIVKWTLYICLSRLMGIRVHAFCLGIGPIRSWIGRYLARLSFSLVNTIIVRDEVSSDWLVNVGIKKARIVLSADPVLNFATLSSDLTEILKSANVPLNKPYVAISIPPFFHDPKRWPNQSEQWKVYCQSWAEVVDDFVMIGVTPVFLPMQHCPAEYRIFSDIDLADKIIKLAKHGASAYTIKMQLTPSEVMTVLAKSELAIAMRLHAIILAVASNTPVAGAVYHHKVAGLVKILDIQDYFIDVSDISPDVLVNTVRKAWVEREEIKAGIRSKLPQIRERIRNGQNIIVKEIRSIKGK